MDDPVPLKPPLSQEEKEYLRAKTEALRAELEEAVLSSKHQRKLERLELRQTEAEARAAELDAASAEIDYQKKVEAEAERRATNKYQRIYVFDSAVTEASVSTCISQLDVWRRIDPGCTITVRFYSPGGDVLAGMYLFDYLQSLKRDGHKLLTEAYGYAASMAGILMQAGDVRRIGAESYVLLHEVQFSVRGKVGEVEDEVEFVKKISDRVLDIFAAGAKRAAEAGTATQPLSRAEFKKRWSRKDWWLTSDECLRYGIVDEIL